MTNVQRDNEQAEQQEKALHIHEEMAADSAKPDEAPQPDQSGNKNRLALDETPKEAPAEAAAPQAAEKAPETAPAPKEEAAAPQAPEAAHAGKVVELERDLYRGKEKPLDEKIRRLEDRPETRRSRPAREERVAAPRSGRREDRMRHRSRQSLREAWEDPDAQTAIKVLLAIVGVVILGREISVFLQLLSNWWALLILAPGIWALEKGYAPFRETGKLPRLSRQWFVAGFVGTLVGLVGLFDMWYLLPLWIILSGAAIWWANKKR